MKKNSVGILVFSLLLMALSLPAMAQIDSPEPETGYYIIHSSGNVVDENGSGRAIIESAGEPAEQHVEFISDNDGYYAIKRLGESKYIALTGSWDTYFIENANTDNAKFAIEKVSDVFIRLRCKANGRYLGTDNTSAGSNIYSDKSGTDSKHHWYISEQIIEIPTDTIATIINPVDRFEKPFEGWGVSLCWWANMCGEWDDDKIDEIVDWLVSPEGLNYNIFRYNIGGGDDPLNRNCTPGHMANGKGVRAEMEGFKDSSEGDFIWSRDAGQRKIMLKIKEKRPDAIFEAFSNSAPYYMTHSGCVAGNTNPSENNLKPEYYQEFAQYLVEVCKFYKDSFDIEFKTLEPFNEPVTNYWGANGGQEGCHFSTVEQIKFLKVLAPVLQASGLNTIIAASDETSTAQSVFDFNAYAADGEVLDVVGQWNTHTYSATHQDRANLRALATEHNKTLWMSEVGSGGSGLSGNLNLAQKLIDDIRYIRPEAWVDWQYLEEGNDQWCLVRGNFAAQTYQRVKNFYVRNQFSHYVPQGSTFLNVPNDKILVALSPDQASLIVVALNNTPLETIHKLDLSLAGDIGTAIHATRTSESENSSPVTDFTLENKLLKVTLPANSVATYVIPVDVDSNQDKALKTEMPYLVIGRTSTLAMQAIDNGLFLQPFVENEEAQIWRLDEAGAGYTLTNLKGEMLRDAGSYLAEASNEEGSGQVFTMETVGDNCYKIISMESGKALDMESGGNEVNTRLGWWEYGNSPAASHRQWIFYPLARIDTPNGIYENGDISNLIRIYGTTSNILILQPQSEIAQVNVYNLNGILLQKVIIQETVNHLSINSGIFIVQHISSNGQQTAVKVKVG